jgi:hypothetical protein
MSDAAARLLARAYILGFYRAWTINADLGPVAQDVVDFLFVQHKTVVTQDWVNEILRELQDGL